MPKDRFGIERKTDDGTLQHSLSPRMSFYATHPIRLDEAILIAMSSSSELRCSEQVPPDRVWLIEDDPMVLVSGQAINRELFGPVVDYKAADFVIPELVITLPVFKCELCDSLHNAASFVAHVQTHTEDQIKEWPSGVFDFIERMKAAEQQATKEGLL